MGDASATNPTPASDDSGESIQPINSGDQKMEDAVRNLLALERDSASEEVICAAFEKSLEIEFSSYEKVLDLYLTRIDGMRRRKHLIRETLEKASDYLTPEMQNTDGLLRLHAYWADLELNVGEDVDRARGVWERFLKDSRRMLAAWNAYIGMEVNLGNIEEARSIYRRCYTMKFDGTGSEDICHGWLRFERKHGGLVDFDYAFEKVTIRLEELQLMRSQQEKREKRKAGPKEEESSAKRQKIKDPKVDEVGGQSANRNTEGVKEEKVKTIFLTRLRPRTTEEDIREFFSDIGGLVNIRMEYNKAGRSKGQAYVDFVDSEHSLAAIDKSGQLIHDKPVGIAFTIPKNCEKS